MFKPNEGFAHSESVSTSRGSFAHSESVSTSRGSFAPCETIYSYNGGFNPAEFIPPSQGAFSPADTHAKLLDDVCRSYSSKHPKDYVEELIMTDPMLFHCLATLIAEYLSAKANSTKNTTAPSHSGSFNGQSMRRQTRVSRRVEETPWKQSEQQQPVGYRRETGNPSYRAAQLSSVGKKAAAEMNSFGYCATGVQNALAKAGMPEFRGKFHGWQAKNVLLNSGMFEEVPLSQVREGDIVCRKTNPNLKDKHAKYGHVAIVGKQQNGRLMEYSDHAQPFIPNHQRYSQTVVLRLKPQYA